MKEILIVGLAVLLGIGVAIYSFGGSARTCHKCAGVMRSYEDNELNHETIYFCERCGTLIAVPR